MQRHEARRIGRDFVCKGCAPRRVTSIGQGCKGRSRPVTLALAVAMSVLLGAAALSSVEEENVLDFYKKYDSDGDLHLDLGEFAASGGKVVADENLESWFREHDVDKDGLLSMGEIASGIFLGFQAADPEEEMARIKNYGGLPPGFQAHPPPGREQQGDGEEEEEEEEDKREGEGWKAEGKNGRGMTAPPGPAMRSLFDIVRDGTVSELKAAIEKTSSVDLQLNDGECTPLHQALELFDGWQMHSHMM